MKSTFVKAKAAKRQELTNISIILLIGSGKTGVETRAQSNTKYWEMRKFMQKAFMVFLIHTELFKEKERM